MGKIKITFLGTGPAGRIPRRGCEAPACLDAERPGSKSRRLQSSVIIESADTAILFDATEDILKQWHHVRDLTHLDAIFISHPHSDAIGGIVHLDTLGERLDQDHMQLFTEQLTEKRIRQKMEVPTRVQIARIVPGGTKKIGPFLIRPFRIEHTNKPTHPTVGFDIRVSGTRIVLMTDVKRVPGATLTRLAQPELCIMDCAICTGQQPNHVNLQEATTIIRRLQPRRTYLTQIGVDWPPFTRARRMARATGSGVDVAYDGLVLTL